MKLGMQNTINEAISVDWPGSMCWEHIILDLGSYGAMGNIVFQKS
jgi:hypothetical protein